LTVTINENLNVSQPNPLSQGQTVVTPDSNVQVDQAKSKMVKFDPGVTLDDLVRAVNDIGAGPSDVMAILEALKQAGAIQGELVVI
ncbi:MAG: flagellar basal body P-ring protein FlgI, partial [Plesiomonas sp.]